MPSNKTITADSSFEATLETEHAMPGCCLETAVIDNKAYQSLHLPALAREERVSCQHKHARTTNRTVRQGLAIAHKDGSVDILAAHTRNLTPDGPANTLPERRAAECIPAAPTRATWLRCHNDDMRDNAQLATNVWPQIPWRCAPIMSEHHGTVPRAIVPFCHGATIDVKTSAAAVNVNHLDQGLHHFKCTLSGRDHLLACFAVVRREKETPEGAKVQLEQSSPSHHAISLAFLSPLCSVYM
jgi:hypothetical protein